MSVPIWTHWRRYWLWPANPPNLLTTTLGGPVTPPFVPTDCPNPRVPAQPQPAQVVNLLTTTLAPPVAAVPFAQTDWPNPPRVSWVIRVDPVVNLPAALVAPFRQSDWPNPTLPRPQSQPSPVPNLLTTTAFVVPPTPFHQTSWPNPLPASSTARADPPNLLATTLGIVVHAPFYQTDWPNPARLPQQPQVVPVPNLLTALVTPFCQSDWPNPTLPRVQPQPQPVPNLLTTTTFVVPAPPFRQLQWPIPPRASTSYADWAPPNVTLSQVPAVVHAAKAYNRGNYLPGVRNAGNYRVGG